MTRIAIVGGGRAATLHAEAALGTAGVELLGVGGRPGTAAALAAAAGVPDLSLPELVSAVAGHRGSKRGGGLIVAVPPHAVAAVVAEIPADVPLLAELPVDLPNAGSGTDTMSGRPIMAAANLLHAPAVKKGLRAIADLGEVHHLTMRGRAGSPLGWPGRPTSSETPAVADVLTLPFVGAWPVLLSAAGCAAAAVSASWDTRSVAGPRVTTTLDMVDGRTITASLEWADSAEGGPVTEIEAASATGVVNIGLWPVPSLEVDGRPVPDSSPRSDTHPLVALGFVEQLRRFDAVCDGRGEPWPPFSVAVGVARLAEAAAFSAAQSGAHTPV